MISGQPFDTAAGLLTVTASVGVAQVQVADEAPEMAYRRADKALYEAKRQGRDRVALAA